MPLMNITEYAAHRGVNQSTISRAIQAGRITRRPDGRIDSRRADREWQANTDQTKPKNSISGQPGGHGGARAGAGRKPSPPPFDPPDADRPGRPGRRRLKSFAEARTERENYQALLARLEYRRESGKLISIQQMKRAVFLTHRRARDLLLTLPARLGSTIAGITDPATVRQMLATEIKQVCAQLSGKFEVDRTDDEPE